MSTPHKIDKTNAALIKNIWHESVPILPNSPAYRYLKNRGISIDASKIESLRFHPNLYYKTGHKFPAMIGSLTDNEGTLVSIQRTFLTAEGYKANELVSKKMLGSTVGLAVKLSENLGEILNITEGIETGLAIQQSVPTPVWATLSTSNMVSLEIPNNITRVLIWADLDSNGAGTNAAIKLRNRLIERKIVVNILVPYGLSTGTDGADWLDALNQKGQVHINEKYLSVLNGCEDSVKKNETKNEIIEKVALLDKTSKLMKLPPKVIRMSDVSLRETEWLWEPRIPIGAPSVLIGEPGVGKSFLMAYIASEVTNGGTANDFTHFTQGSVVIFNMEDSLDSTLKNRLNGTAAIQEKIFAVEDKIVFDDEGKEYIKQIVQDHSPKLVVFDPLTSYLGADVDMNRANQVRDKMEFAISLAREFNIAVVCVLHTNKNEMGKNLLFRALGSVDFLGAVRSALMVVKNPEEDGVKLLGHIKSNLSTLAQTLAYRIDNGNAVSFIDVYNKSLEQIFDEAAQKAHKEKNQRALDDARNFLNEALKDYPVKTKALIEEAKENGISHATLRRAMEEITGHKRIVPKFAIDKKGYTIRFLKIHEDKYKKVEHVELVNLWDLNDAMQAEQDVQDAQDAQHFSNGKPDTALED